MDYFAGWGENSCRSLRMRWQNTAGAGLCFRLPRVKASAKMCMNIASSPDGRNSIIVDEAHCPSTASVRECDTLLEGSSRLLRLFDRVAVTEVRLSGPLFRRGYVLLMRKEFRRIQSLARLFENHANILSAQEMSSQSGIIKSAIPTTDGRNHGRRGSVAAGFGKTTSAAGTTLNGDAPPACGAAFKRQRDSSTPSPFKNTIAGAGRKQNGPIHARAGFRDSGS